MVTNKIGQPVTGSDFFDRERERRQIWDFLHRDHLLLLAARRVGKTSLMLRLREEAPEKGFAVAYASVADVEDEAGFTRRLLSAVAEAQGDTGRLDRLASGPLGKLLRRVKKVEAFSTGFELAPFDDSEWQSVGESLARALDRQQGRWLLLVDELPLFVLELVRKDPEGRRARRFLSWFRGLRQQADLTGSLRWLLAGSIGLDTVAARIRAGDTINDLHLIHLGPFTPELADRLLEELAASHEFPLADEVRTRMLRRVGWLIPYHLQLLFSKLRERCEDHGEPPTVTAVDDAIEALLRPARATSTTGASACTRSLGAPTEASLSGCSARQHPRRRVSPARRCRWRLASRSPMRTSGPRSCAISSTCSKGTGISSSTRAGTASSRRFCASTGSAG